MKKRFLFLTGFLLLLFYTGCYDDRIDKRSSNEVVPDFDVGDAKAWFDSHAEELNLLKLNKSVETKGLKLTNKPLLTPQWSKGDALSNPNLQVVEVPLLTNSISFVYRNLHRVGRSVINEDCIAQRKLVIMRRPNGYTRLFVMTLIPDRGYRRRNFDFISGFRYLGKSDFSGYVIFSDPDGSFVEGYHYFEGNKEYMVQMTPIQEAREFLSVASEYTTLSISERGTSSDSTYTEEEQNNICDNCNGEGCSMCANRDCLECNGAGCTHCKNVPLPPVVVTPPDPPVNPPGPIGPGGIINPGCSKCGWVTCNGNCISTGGITKPSICEKCKQPNTTCKCPKKENCTDIAIKNSDVASYNWNAFLKAGLKNAFLDKYRNATVEYTTSLDHKDGNYSLTPVTTNNQNDNTTIQFGKYTEAGVHNHPGGNSPSIKDVFALIKMNMRSNGKFESSYIVPKTGPIYVLHIEDRVKIENFSTLYNENNTILQEELENNWAWLIRHAGEYPEKELSGYALATILQQFNSGVSLLQLEGSGGVFKQLNAKVEMQGGQIVKIIYTICK